MTTAAGIRDKIWYGYGKAAQHLGFPVNQFRPTTANNPVGGAPLRSILASFAVGAKYTEVEKYGSGVWRIVVDGRKTQVGDYFVGARTYFMISQQPMLPMLAVLCNQVVSLAVPGGQAAVAGANSYGGSTLASQTTYAANWPASIRIHGRGRDGEVDLPGDLRNPWWDILLPAIPGVTIKTRDIVTDQSTPPRRFIISAAELSDMGWRIEAEQAVV